MHYSPQTVKEVLAVGARGFLLKSDAGRDLVTAVEAVQLNRTFFTSKVTEIVVDGYLNPTPKEILRYLHHTVGPVNCGIFEAACMATLGAIASSQS